MKLNDLYVSCLLGRLFISHALHCSLVSLEQGLRHVNTDLE